MANIKIPTVILFCKHTVLFILHKKCGLVVKGRSAPFCIFFVTSKTKFRFSDSIHGCLHSKVSVGKVSSRCSR